MKDLSKTSADTKYAKELAEFGHAVGKFPANPNVAKAAFLRLKSMAGTGLAVDAAATGAIFHFLTRVVDSCGKEAPPLFVNFIKINDALGLGGSISAPLFSVVGQFLDRVGIGCNPDWVPLHLINKTVARAVLAVILILTICYLIL